MAKRRGKKDYMNTSWLDPGIPLLYDWYDEYPYDLAMWRKLCERSGDPILDVACGTGRVAIELARAGFTVAGLDLSPAMIARATERLQCEDEPVRARVAFHVADMADFQLDQLFRTIVVPCFSFHELTTLTAQESCLRTLRCHLIAGGTLILTLGVWTPPELTSEPEEPAEFGRPMEEGLNPHTQAFTRMWSLSWGDPATLTKYHRFYFEEHDASGRLLRKFALPEPPNWHARRFLTQQDAQTLLWKHDFRVESLYGDWDLKPFDTQSSCMIFVCRHGTQKKGRHVA